MTFRIALAAVVGLLPACSSERDDKPAACAKLREHVAELSVARGGANLAPEEQAKHVAGLVASSGDEFIRRCVREWSEKSIDCALDAASTDAVRRCVAAR
jgi:hypothetical protein